MEKVFFQTYGCSNNHAESEIMKGLTKEHFDVVDSVDLADVIVLNICTVKGDDSALSQIKSVSEKYPYKAIIVGGCIPIHLVKKIRRISPKCGMLNTHNIDKIIEIIEETLNNNPSEILARERLEKVGFERLRRNKVVGIVPISNSCLGNCTYCSVKPIKGEFYSFSETKILDDVKSALNEGCKEIWVTSQDNGCYGKDTDSSLPALLRKIVEIPGDFLVRVGMMNPNQILPYLDELIDVMKHKKIFKFVHIPVQSGSDRILKKMQRHYTFKEFVEIIEKFRLEIPLITISTDVIVGFPTETNDDFEDTLNLIKLTKPDILNVSKYRRRPNTKAYKMEQVNPELIKMRVNRLNTAFEWGSFENNKKWVGWEGIVLIDELGKENSFVGRNEYYKPIIIPNINSKLKLGVKVKVKIKNCTTFDLRIN